jgi:phosphatidylglycerophosphate synthase
MKKTGFYFVNAITLYRLVMAPVMLFVIIFGSIDIFKWLLAISFSTDAIDGFLARKFKAASIFGSRLDSVADDLTILAGITGLFVYKLDFIKEHVFAVTVLIVLLLLQNILALIKYGKISSFHTILAKIAAVFQGSFLILIFFLPEPMYSLFYIAVVFSALDLIEEIILVFILKEWKTNVKGLYWVLKQK